MPCVTARDGYNLSFGRCEGWQDEWADAAVDADADVALVVLGAWDVFDFELDDGTELEFGTSEWDTYVTENLQSGIDALAATGAHVALLEVPCMRPQDVEGAGVPALPERGDDDRVAHLNELWRDVAEDNPDTVTFVEGPDEWCDDEDVSDDVAYRWDGVHVYKPGANLIYTTIAPTLLTLYHRAAPSAAGGTEHSVDKPSRLAEGSPLDAERGDAGADGGGVLGIGTQRLRVERRRIELQLADAGGLAGGAEGDLGGQVGGGFRADRLDAGGDARPLPAGEVVAGGLPRSNSRVRSPRNRLEQSAASSSRSMSVDSSIDQSMASPVRSSMS